MNSNFDEGFYVFYQKTVRELNDHVVRKQLSECSNLCEIGKNQAWQTQTKCEKNTEKICQNQSDQKKAEKN